MVWRISGWAYTRVVKIVTERDGLTPEFTIYQYAIHLYLISDFTIYLYLIYRSLLYLALTEKNIYKAKLVFDAAHV